MIYNSSVDGFDLVKFHQKCDNIKNLVFLVKTEFNKSFGCFTGGGLLSKI